MPRTSATHAGAAPDVHQDAFHTAVASASDGWLYEGPTCLDYGRNLFCYQPRGHQSGWTCRSETQAEANARKYRHRWNQYKYFLRRGLKLIVQAMDRCGNEVSNNGHTMEWLPNQTVQEVISEFADDIPRAL